MRQRDACSGEDWGPRDMTPKLPGWGGGLWEGLALSGTSQAGLVLSGEDPRRELGNVVSVLVWAEKHSYWQGQRGP